jgi:acetylornithine deacetylase/succinyl-diaminopimelate desuccinylase-like protein
VTDDIIRYLEGQHQTILERLKAVLRLPSVSTDPAYADGMAATRAHFLQRLKEMGLDDVQLLDGGGHPALYGAWRGAPGAPTFIIYGHYDVQPPDEGRWRTPGGGPSLVACRGDKRTSRPWLWSRRAADGRQHDVRRGEARDRGKP